MYHQRPVAVFPVAIPANELRVARLRLGLHRKEDVTEVSEVKCSVQLYSQGCECLLVAL